MALQPDGHQDPSELARAEALLIDALKIFDAAGAHLAAAHAASALESLRAFVKNRASRSALR